MLAVIEYYIDGSTKENTVGAGIVKINEFGFIEKRHFTIEHTDPSSQTAEGYAFEKALELIAATDLHKNEMIDLYTDCRQLQNSLSFNQHVEFHRSDFFTKQEPNGYFLHLRGIYRELIIRNSKSCIYHCAKTQQSRPLIKVFFKDDAEDKKYMQEAHSLSRKYIKKEELKVLKVELKAIRKESAWQIIRNNGEVVAFNKRPLIALSEALTQMGVRNNQIKLCVYLENLLKSTNKNKLSNESIKSAMKIIDKHKKSFVS